MSQQATTDEESKAEEPDEPESGAPGKYEQTWPKSYAETNCQEWRKEMNDHQRFVGAADMLIGVWKVDGTEGVLPPDLMVESFAADLSEACEANNELTANEVGVTLYLTAKKQYGPP